MSAVPTSVFPRLSLGLVFVLIGAACALTAPAFGDDTASVVELKIEPGSPLVWTTLGMPVSASTEGQPTVWILPFDSTGAWHESSGLPIVATARSQGETFVFVYPHAKSSHVELKCDAPQPLLTPCEGGFVLDLTFGQELAGRRNLTIFGITAGAVLQVPDQLVMKIPMGFEPREENRIPYGMHERIPGSGTWVIDSAALLKHDGRLFLKFPAEAGVSVGVWLCVIPVLLNILCGAFAWLLTKRPRTVLRWAVVAVSAGVSTVATSKMATYDSTAVAGIAGAWGATLVGIGLALRTSRGRDEAESATQELTAKDSGAVR